MSLVYILQIILVIMFLMSGLMKLMMPKAKLAMKMKPLRTLSGGQIKLLGLLEVLGALGIILPMWVSLPAMLPFYAVLGLALVVFSAVIAHLKVGDKKEAMMPLVLLIIAVYVLYAMKYLG